MTFHKERYPSDWKAIRAGILLRANNRCEVCSAPNREFVIRGEYSHEGTYMLAHGETFDAATGAFLGHSRGSEYDGRPVAIVLTVAHLDHDEANNAAGNLAALCQRCHLNYDRADNRRRASINKQAATAATQPSLFKGV